MLDPTMKDTPLGRARQTVFIPPYIPSDWVTMDDMIQNAEVSGMALRFIADDRVSVVVTTTGD